MCLKLLTNMEKLFDNCAKKNFVTTEQLHALEST